MSRKSGKTMISLELDKSLARKAAVFSAQYDISRSELVRQALIEFMKSNKPKPQWAYSDGDQEWDGVGG